MDPKDNPKEPKKAPRETGKAREVETTGGASRTDPSMAIPAHIGRFVVRKVLGKGAFGSVYLAADPTLSRDVAIKIPHDGLAPELKARFLREARATATIHHPNVCPVYEVGTHGDVPYIVMHYVAGTTLAAHLNQRGALPPAQAVAVAQKLALGIAAAHEKGVVHRDLKPANVLFDPARTLAVITDFGLATLVSESQTTADGAVCGTPAYMSPEQARGKVSEIGPQSDVYALGVILFHLLTGDVPFRGPVFTVLAQHAQAPPPRPSERQPDLDTQLDAIVQKAMAKKQADRYPSARALADALTEYTNAGSRSSYTAPASRPAVPQSVVKPASPAAPKPPTAPPRPVPEAVAPPPRGSRNLLAIGGLLLLVFVAGVLSPRLVGLFSRNRQVPVVQPYVPDVPAPYADAPAPKNPEPKKVDPKPPEPEPKGPEPKKVDPPPPESKKVDPPSIANGFAGHTFDQAAERRVAEWVLTVGGAVRVTMPGGKSEAVTDAKALPPAFTISEIRFASYGQHFGLGWGWSGKNLNFTDDTVTKNLVGLSGPIKLKLVRNGIGNEALKVFARIPKLEELDISDVPGVGDDGLAALTGHPALRSLTINGTGITSKAIRTITALPALTELEVGRVDADQWLVELAPLTRLTRLCVRTSDDNKLTDRGLACLQSLKKLTQLDVVSRGLGDDHLRHLSELTELEELNLSGTAVKGPGLIHLKSLAKFKKLNLISSQLTDEGCAHLGALPRLAELDLSGTPISDAGVKHLAQMKTLTRIDLRNTRATPTGLFELHVALPKCAITPEPKRTRAELDYQQGEQFYHSRPAEFVSARAYYEKAAAQSYAPAQYALGHLYQFGLGVSKDSTKAREWYEKAATQGHAEAQASLGYLYASGTGVTKDLARALEWYRKAAAQGNRLAINEVERIEKKE